MIPFFHMFNRLIINECKLIRNRYNVGNVLNNVKLSTCTENSTRRAQFNSSLSKNFLKIEKSTFLNISRHYAKNKDRKKDKGKTKVVINEVQMAEVLNVDSIKTQMQNCIEQLKEDFIKHLSLRSSTGSIESLQITIDGEEHTLQELAQISRKNPKTVVIDMAIFPQAIPEVLKAIENSALNVNPQQDGTTLYIPIPKVTKEHRENLAKNAKQLHVKCKDNVRGVQNKYTKSLKKKDGISEDLIRNIEMQLKALADKYIEDADRILGSKQKELLGESL